MKIILPQQIDLNDVEALSRRLATTRTTGASKFFLQLPERDCKNAMWSAFRAEVEGSGSKAVADADTLQHISDAALWLINPHEKPSLMLQGRVGTGKTMLARGICNLVKFLTSLSDSASHSVEPVFVKAKKVCEQFVRYPVDYERLRATRILVIDELGEEPKEIMQYGMLYTPVADLLEERYDRRRCTIVTTNLTGNELKAHYGSRLHDRFREMFTSITFLGDSRRT